MEDLTKDTPTELLYKINKITDNHVELKGIIYNDTLLINELEEKVNDNLRKLKDIENKYVELIQELTIRDNVIREETDTTE